MPTLEALVQELSSIAPAEEVRRMHGEYLQLGMSPDRAITMTRKRLVPESQNPGAYTKEPQAAKDLSPLENATLEAIIESRFPGKTPNGPKWNGKLHAFGESVPYSCFKAEFPEAGDHIRLTGCKIGAWNNAPQVTLGDRTRIEILVSHKDAPVLDVQIRDVTAARRNVNLEGRIMQARQVPRQGKSPFWAGLIADATGTARWVAWEADPGFKEDDVVRLERVEAGFYKGSPNLTIGKETKVQAATTQIPPRSELVTHARTTITELQRTKRDGPVEVRGLIVEVKADSGIVHKCPQCSKVMERGICRDHGAVKSVPDLRLKYVLDDGTETITVYANRQAVEGVLGKTFDEIRRDVFDSGDPSLLAVSLAERLVGCHAVVRGQAFGKDDVSLFEDNHELTLPDVTTCLPQALRDVGLAQGVA